MNAYTLEPQDLLFFRDGRPIATAGGHGARWPEASIIFDALHAALHRAFPEPMPWEHAHRFGRGSARDPGRDRTQRFGSLVTAGLFPVWPDGRWLAPAPADAHPSPDPTESMWRLDPMPARGAHNLPARFLKYVAANFTAPSKETPSPWWSTGAWNDYLQDRCPQASERFENHDVFDGEWTTGIGIDPETRTQDGQRLYSAEYLRLRPQVRCGFLASLPMKQNGTPVRRETLHHLFAASNTIIVGGQQRPCRVEIQRSDPPPLPLGKTHGFSAQANLHRVKWVLLSPAIWPEITADPEKGILHHPGGWLPNWVCADSGRVLLRHRAGEVRRVWSEAKRRTVRRAESEGEIAAWLVGACVPKPVPVTGWTERLHLLHEEAIWTADGAERPHGPRGTHLAVPAGAVYYFETQGHEAAIELAAALNWHGAGVATGIRIRNRRSTLLGEKGFGLGICGTWTISGT